MGTEGTRPLGVGQDILAGNDDDHAVRGGGAQNANRFETADGTVRIGRQPQINQGDIGRRTLQEHTFYILNRQRTDNFISLRKMDAQRILNKFIVIDNQKRFHQSNDYL